ncbi:amidohydrolase family protein [Roseiarcaceae bacterium H3SJ34-1]|uniref:amidohydrolase family protein n=1 Tax=Terripilifer ovatus TaxID=3032367 RepID=UPI003AB9B827|nr:amidohydrolase family protein [Roseiarcaceae bacterium H3SJ34-1]
MLIRGGSVVSMDDHVGNFIGDILVHDGRIAAIAPAIAPPPGAEVLDATGKIVMPGFVNAHMHTWQTGLRGVAADWTISQYLRAIHAGLATHFRPEDIYIANLVGALSQLNCGTTTLVDWCHNNPSPEHTDAAVGGLVQSGIRALFLHGSPKPDPKPGQKHFSEVPMPRNEVVRLRRGQLASDDALVTLGLAILGPCMSIYDVCCEDFRLARETGTVASMHVTGPLLTPDGFERLAGENLLGPALNIVHGNVLSDAQLDLLVGHGVHFTVTAEVEMQMGFGRPLTGRLRRRGASISIGSDIESGMSSDMFTVTRMTLQAQRFLDSLDSFENSGQGPAEITIPCREALRWSTIDAARMAGLDQRTGSLTPGKAADIVVLSARDLNMHPVVDPVASIVLQAGVANVDTVIVGGIVRKRDGVMLYSDMPRRLDELAQSSMRILTDFNKARAA